MIEQQINDRTEQYINHKMHYQECNYQNIKTYTKIMNHPFILELRQKYI